MVKAANPSRAINSAAASTTWSSERSRSARTRLATVMLTPLLSRTRTVYVRDRVVNASDGDPDLKPRLVAALAVVTASFLIPAVPPASAAPHAPEAGTVTEPTNGGWINEFCAGD